MELTLNPAAATDQIDSAARPQDEDAPDGGFDVLLAMVLQAAPLVAPPTVTGDEQVGGDVSQMTSAVRAASADVLSVVGPAGVAPAGSEPAAQGQAAATADGAAVDPNGDESVAQKRMTTVAAGVSSVPHPESAAASERPRAASADALSGNDERSSVAPAQSAVPAEGDGSSSQSTAGEGDDAGRSGRELPAAARREQRPAELQPSPTGGAEARVDGLGPLAQAAPDARAAASIQTNASRNTGPTLVPQLMDGLHLALDQQGSAVRLQLHPDGLGSVHLRVASSESGLSIHIAVDDPATRDMIQAAVGQLSQNLEGRGLAVAHLLVDLATSQGGRGQAHESFEGSSPSSPARLTDSDVAGNESPATDGRAAAYRIDYRV